MSGVNKVILLGNVGKDPEIKYLEGNIPVAKFSMATTEYHKNREGQRTEQTEWHNIVLWRGLAEVTEKLVRKGCTVYLEGKLRTRTWEDQHQQKRYSTEIIADVLNVLTRRHDDNGGTHPQKQTQEEPANTLASDPVLPTGTNATTDDLPF